MENENQVRLPETSTLIVSTSPHIHDASGGYNVRQIMLYVILSLLPGCAAGVWFFGLPALYVIVACVCSCVFFEWLWCKIAGREKSSIGDLSAIVTGLLLAMNLSAAIPLWIAVLGSLFAIWIAKMLYGGLGYNPFNPAITARVFLLLACTSHMTAFVTTRFATESTLFSPVLDATATPLQLTHGVTAAQALQALPGDAIPYMDYLIGNMPGCLGETSAIALTLGGLFLIIMRVIKWQVPLAYFATVAVLITLINTIAPGTTPNAVFHLLTGGVILGGFFMITDMVTTPITTSGGIIFAVGAGVLTVVIRVWGGYPEGCSFSILLMNALTPLIDRYTRRNPFGYRKPQKKEVA